MQTITHEYTLLLTLKHVRTHTQTHTCTQTYTFALQLEKRRALGYLQSQWCLNTLSVASSGDWQRLNEYFLSLNSIIKSLAVPGQEKMFKFTLGESYSYREFFPPVVWKLLQLQCWLRYLSHSALSFLLLLDNLAGNAWFKFRAQQWHCSYWPFILLWISVDKSEHKFIMRPAVYKKMPDELPKGVGLNCRGGASHDQWKCVCVSTPRPLFCQLAWTVNQLSFGSWPESCESVNPLGSYAPSAIGKSHCHTPF